MLGAREIAEADSFDLPRYSVYNNKSQGHAERLDDRFGPYI